MSGSSPPKSPRISIVLPTYNRPDVLRFAIESVLGQTVADFELIVIGDGCTDGTAGVVGSFMERDPRVRWLDLPKAPFYGYANINVGLKEASGEFLAYMAHDDLWLPDHLESLLAFFTDDAVDVAYSRPLWISPEGHIYPLSFNLHDAGVLEDFVSMRRNSLPAACFVIRSNCLERFGAWDETLSENADWDVWARIIRKGGRHNFAYLTEPTCLHFRAIWKTEANPGPADLFTWKHRYETSRGDPVFSVDVAGFPTEQEAFAQRLKQDPAFFSEGIRRECQRLLDRMVMEGDLLPVQLLHQVREQEDRIDRLCSQIGVFEYAPANRGGGVIYGHGVFPDEEGSRWLSREARMILLNGGAERKASFTLRCGEAELYEQFPLTLEIFVNGALVASETFKSSGKKHSVSLRLTEDVNELVARSSSAYVPQRCGINDDRRQLSLQMTKIKLK